MSENQVDRFKAAVDDHAMEGVEIIESESSFFVHGLLYVVFAGVLGTLVWSYFSKLDVIITAQGRIAQELGLKSVYSPTDGELVEIYISEGVPVERDQIIARVKSPQAINAATQAQQAYLKLKAAEKEKETLGEKLDLFDRQIETIKKQVQLEERELSKAKTLELQQMSVGQRQSLKDSQFAVEDAEREVMSAKDLLDKYVRLSQSEGGGGVSKLQVQQKREEYQRKLATKREAVNRYKKLEQEFSSQNIGLQKKIEAINMKLVQMNLKLSEASQQKDKLKDEVEIQYQGHLSAWQAASKVSFADLDRDNFLEIKSPIEGEVVTVNFKQAGEKIRAVRPIAVISPADSRKMLVVAISDKDRGLLKVGQPVKMKFNAFPFHRFGFISGELEYISNTAVAGQKGEPLYKGRVSLDKDFFTSEGTTIPLRYGMMAAAEILVQKRRVIDVVLDPFRRQRK